MPKGQHNELLTVKGREYVGIVVGSGYQIHQINFGICTQNAAVAKQQGTRFLPPVFYVIGFIDGEHVGDQLACPNTRQHFVLAIGSRARKSGDRLGIQTLGNLLVDEGRVCETDLKEVLQVSIVMVVPRAEDGRVPATYRFKQPMSCVSEGEQINGNVRGAQRENNSDTHMPCS